MIKTFCMWSLFYTILRLVHVKEVPLIEVAKYFIRGHYHLWFIYLISSLYLITPIIRCITSSPKATEYYIIIGFFIYFFLPRLSDFCSQFSIFGIDNISSAIQYVLTNTSFSQKTGYYVYYYILGYYLHANDLTKAKAVLIYCLGILGCLLTVILTEWYSLENKMASGRYYSPETLNVFFTTVSVYLFAKELELKQKFCARMKKAIHFTARYSFSIYLLHPFVLGMLGSTFGLTTLSFNPIFSTPILAICVFCITWALSILLEFLSFYVYERRSKKED